MWSASPAIDAASTVTMRTRSRAVAGAPSSISDRRAILSSASRLGLPLGSQSAPRPTRMPRARGRPGERRPAVQPEVALGRPHEARARGRNLVQVGGLEGRPVDDHGRGRQEVGVDEVPELVTRRRVGALGEVDVDGVDLAGVDPRPEGRTVGGRRPVEVDDRSGAVRAEDPAVDVPDEGLLDGRELAVRALDRGRSRHEGPRLRVAAQRPLEGRVLLHLRQRLLDDRVVLLRRPPAAPVRVQLRRLPRREHVVLGVAVEVDEAGQDDAVGVEAPDPGRGRRGPDPGHDARRRCRPTRRPAAGWG